MNCELHMHSTLHKPEQYAKYAKDLEERIKHFIPESKVWINQFKEWWTISYIDVKITEFTDRKILNQQNGIRNVIKQLKAP